MGTDASVELWASLISSIVASVRNTRPDALGLCEEAPRRRGEGSCECATSLEALTSASSLMYSSTHRPELVSRQLV